MPVASLSRRPLRPTLLIVGCGDVGLRVLRRLRGRWRVLALTSSPARCAALRAEGAVPLVGNLDSPATLGRLAGLADAVLHLAPPPSAGTTDPRTRALVQALARRGRGAPLVYGSTSGVYGDAGGERVPETRPLAPGTARAHRRVDAERQVRDHARRTHGRAMLLRIPGIYAFDRDGGNPLERVARGTPVLVPADDVHTNHIHADDLARACVAALHRLLAGRGNLRAVNVADESTLPMGDHYTELARLAGLPAPARIDRAQARAVLPPMTMSFLEESRRLVTERMRRELRLPLHHPTVIGAARRHLAAHGGGGPAQAGAASAVRP